MGKANTQGEAGKGSPSKHLSTEREPTLAQQKREEVSDGHLNGFSDRVCEGTSQIRLRALGGGKF